jgi:hypothetical protein
LARSHNTGRAIFFEGASHGLQKRRKAQGQVMTGTCILAWTLSMIALYGVAVLLSLPVSGIIAGVALYVAMTAHGRHDTSRSHHAGASK